MKNASKRGGDVLGIHYGLVILVMSTCVVFGALGLARFGYSILLTPMQSALGLDNTQAGVLATANLAGYLVLSVVGGALASRYGPRAVIAAGLALAGAAMILTGFSEGMATAALWRGVTGLGSGASNVPVMALLAAWFAPRRRGLAAGVGVSGSSFALILLGPSVPPLLTHFGDAGWRVCWGLLGAITLILAAAASLLLRNHPDDVGALPLGALPGEPPPAPRAAPLRWASVYRSWTVWHLGLVYVAFGFAYIIYLTFFVKHLMSDGGYTHSEAGRLFMLMGWCSVLCGLIWGAVSDALGRKWALVIVYGIQTAAFTLFALAPNPLGFTVSAVLFGLTAWSIPAIMAAACGDMLGPRMAPAALGFITLFFGIGQAAGPSVAGALADASGSLSSSFLLAGGVAVLGGAGAALLRPSSAGS
ncbi:MAG TPA: MFS transporter [Candidatus Hydrogenedentes bacterium]|nr:MFS transporter [Candidatus Hydrogenedentota bacterium]